MNIVQKNKNTYFNRAHAGVSLMDILIVVALLGFFLMLMVSTRSPNIPSIPFKYESRFQQYVTVYHLSYDGKYAAIWMKEIDGDSKYTVEWIWTDELLGDRLVGKAHHIAINGAVRSGEQVGLWYTYRVYDLPDNAHREEVDSIEVRPIEKTDQVPESKVN